MFQRCRRAVLAEHERHRHHSPRAGRAGPECRAARPRVAEGNWDPAPPMHDDRRFEIEGGRHPVVEARASRVRGRAVLSANRTCALNPGTSDGPRSTAFCTRPDTMAR